MILHSPQVSAFGFNWIFLLTAVFVVVKDQKQGFDGYACEVLRSVHRSSIIELPSQQLPATFNKHMGARIVSFARGGSEKQLGLRCSSADGFKPSLSN
jgi:hypothetical protein